MDEADLDKISLRKRENRREVTAMLRQLCAGAFLAVLLTPSHPHPIISPFFSTGALTSKTVCPAPFFLRIAEI